jgi:hypothetical protein
LFGNPTQTIVRMYGDQVDELVYLYRPCDAAVAGDDRGDAALLMLAAVALGDRSTMGVHQDRANWV